MKVIIRSDSSQHIGSGHIMRCLSLAEGLRNSNISVEFITRDHLGNFNELIINKGFMLYSLPSPDEYNTRSDLFSYESWLGVKQEVDAKETINILSKLTVDWLIIDHYALDQIWEERIKSYSNRVMVIDDLANRNHSCDLLLDTTEGRSQKDYFQKVHKHCGLLLGAKYSLLREQFVNYRSKALERRFLNQIVKNILVSFGGSDPSDATSFALRCIEKADIGATIDIILDERSPHTKKVLKQISSMKTLVRLNHRVENMAKYMTRADIAIGAGGITSWERCCLGLPTIVLVTEHNQTQVATNLHNIGAILSLGMFDNVKESDMVGAILNIVSNQQKRFNISENASKICDGNGVKRVVKAIINGT
jgi:UDP-2,4-diacetamido-2,4,6-trideoxy-beta-L-altropyranose hydrolase